MSFLRPFDKIKNNTSQEIHFESKHSNLGSLNYYEMFSKNTKSSISIPVQQQTVDQHTVKFIKGNIMQPNVQSQNLFSQKRVRSNNSNNNLDVSVNRNSNSRPTQLNVNRKAEFFQDQRKSSDFSFHERPEDKENSQVNNMKVDDCTSSSRIQNRIQKCKRIQVRSYQLDAVGLVFNRIQRYMSAVFQKIRDCEGVNKQVFKSINLQTQEPTENSLLASIIIEKKVFYSESLLHNSSQNMQVNEDPLQTLNSKLDQFQNSITSQNSLYNLRDSQQMNGFKVSFANLQSKQFKRSQSSLDDEDQKYCIMRKSSKRNMSSCEDEDSKIKNDNTTMKDKLYEIRSLMINLYDPTESSQKENRPLKGRIPVPSNPLANQSSPELVKEQQAERTVTSFECNLSNLKESNIYCSDIKQQAVHKLSEFNSFTNMLSKRDNSRKKEYEQSFVDFIAEDQSEVCSFAFPNSNIKKRPHGTLNQLFMALCNQQKRVQAQILKQLHVYTLKQHLSQMNHKLSIIKVENLKRIVQKKIAVDRIIMKVCLEQWQGYVQHVNKFRDFGRKIIKLKNSILSQGLTRINLHVHRKQSIIKLDSIFKNRLNQAQTQIQRYNQKKLSLLYLSNGIYKIMLNLQNVGFIGIVQCSLKVNNQQQLIIPIVKKIQRCQQKQMKDSLQIMMIQFIKHQYNVKLIGIGMSQIDNIFKEQLRNCFNHMRVQQIQQNKKSEENKLIYYKLLILVLNKQFSKVVSGSFYKLNYPSQDKRKKHEEQQGNSLFEKYKRLQFK